MPRRPWVWLVAAVAATVAGVGLWAAVTPYARAFTLGVSPDDQVVGVYAEREVCQQPVDVPAPFAFVAFTASGDEPSGPPLEVEIRSLPGDRRIGRGVFDDAYTQIDRHLVSVGEVPAGQRVAVCFRALGEGGEPDADEDEGARLGGGPDQAARTSSVVLNGERRPDDLSLIFVRGRSTTLLALVPDMLERAALWRPGPASGVLVGVLLLGAVLATPVLLGRAVALAGDSEYGDGPKESAPPA